MNTLSTLLKGALGRKVPAEFAAENYDYKAALRDELKKNSAKKKTDTRNYRNERKHCKILST